MARDERKYYDSILNLTVLKDDLRKFLTTHKNGCYQLSEWMKSVPPDRTAEEYYAALAKQDAELEAHRAETLVRVNRERAQNGLGPIEFRDLNGPEEFKW